MTTGIANTSTQGCKLLFAVLACNLALSAGAARAAPLTLWGAGSLTGALGAVAGDYTAATGVPVTTRFLSSGTLRQEIEAGGRPDLFTSADTGNPLALQQQGLSGPVVPFTTNRLVAVARPGLDVNTGNLLATLLDPAIRVGTSTPISDPSGDYAQQVFANADELAPGAFATLDAKALRLVGSPAAPPVPAGQNSLVYFIDTTGQADIFLTYYTGALAARQIAPGLQAVELPPDLAVSAQYGLTILNGADPGTGALADYILSPTGQSVLARFGFGAATAVPEPASVAVLGFALACVTLTGRRRGRRVA